MVYTGLNMDTEKVPITSSKGQDYGSTLLFVRDSNRKIYLKKAILIVLFVLACAAAVAFVLHLTIFAPQQSAPVSTFEYTKESEISTLFPTELQFSTYYPACVFTSSCHAYAQLLSATMDLSVDPCEDFYEHVCANWSLSHAGSHRAFQLEIAYHRVELALKDNRTIQSKSKLVQYMTQIYLDFMDGSARKQTDFVAMLGQLLSDNQLSLFGASLSDDMVMSHSNVTNSCKTIESFSDFLKVWISWKSNPEAGIKPEGDTPDIELWMDLFVEASLMQVDTFVKSVKIFNKEIHIKFDQNEAYAPDDGLDDRLYQEFQELKKQISIFFNIKTNEWNCSLNYVLFEMLDFKLALGKIYAESEIDPNLNYFYAYDLIELQDGHDTFNWTLLLSKFANKTKASTQFLDDDDVEVVTHHFDLLTPLTKLISSTPIRVLQNVMAWHYMNALDELKSASLWRQFVDKDFETFLPLYIRLFVDYVGRWQMQVHREQAKDIMLNLQKTFVESLKREHTWLDDETRKKALEKVMAMESMISYPDWVLNDTALDEHFGFDNAGCANESLQSIKGNFAFNYLNLFRIVQSGNFRKLAQNGTRQNERKCDLAFSDIGYHCFSSNYISVTHAILLDPSFNFEYPIELKYGHLGSTIAHELLHGFDNIGIKYDKYGDEINWWSEYTAKQYEDRSQCFVQQYGQHGINGTFTLGENISDNGGLNLAYRLFEKHLNYSPVHSNAFSQSVPPILAQYSHEQLFFVAYAMEHCAHQDDSSSFVSPDGHSPPKYRVNIPLQNLESFAQAFHCPVESKMNPKQKCLLW